MLRQCIECKWADMMPRKHGVCVNDRANPIDLSFTALQQETLFILRNIYMNDIWVNLSVARIEGHHFESNTATDTQGKQWYHWKCLKLVLRSSFFPFNKIKYHVSILKNPVIWNTKT